MSNTFISVIVPVYNEEKYIGNCIESMLNQDFPKDSMEWFFIDGLSSDKTLDIIREYQNQYPKLITILSNPNKTVPYAINMGIKASKGEYIIRLDAHAEYAADYFSKCIEVLEKTGADNVGGALKTKARSKTGLVISKMLSSKFGVGASAFRTHGAEGFVDTVPFGACKKELFDRIGGYDEKLLRNEDNEFNSRIIQNGGKVYLSNEIKLSYYCRERVSELLDMAFANGKWNIITARMYKGSMKLRHFVPFVFVLSLLFLPLLGLISKLFLTLLKLELLLYLLLDLIFSLKACDSVSCFLSLILLFPIFHVAYGIGSLIGFFTSSPKL